MDIHSKLNELKSFQQGRVEKLIDLLLSNNNIDINNLLDENQMVCRSCGHTHFVKNGHSSKGHARYKCKECDSTQSNHANTPVYRLKKKELYVDFIELMLSSTKPLTLNEIAEKLSINKNTALAWRHRFLTSLNDVKSLDLGDEIEMDEVYIPFCVKGNLGKEKFEVYDHKNKENRVPNDVRLIELDKQNYNTVWMCLHNRKGDFDFLPLNIQAKGHVSSDLIKDAMKSINLDDKVVITDNNTALAKYIRENTKAEHYTFKSMDVKKGVVKDKGIHNNNINNTMSLYKRWSSSFFGNSTKYQWNYLKWFRFTRLFNDNVKEMTKCSLKDHESFNRFNNIFDYYIKYLVA